MSLYELFKAGTLDPATHLRGVTAVPARELVQLCKQFNFAGTNLPGQAGEAAIRAVFERAGVVSPEALVARLNEKWQPYRRPAPRKTGGIFFLAMIDRLWLNVIRPVPENLILPFANMIDPEGDAATGPSHAMPSPVPGGFRRFGIVFRVDNRAYDELAPAGFLARFAVPPGDRFHVEGAYGTVASRGMAWDKVHRDFASETGVSLSRNPIGSMKFLLTGSQPRAHLYAVKLDSGFDTEAAQMARQVFHHDRTALWRPGEKAAFQVPKWKIMASCEVEKSTRFGDYFRRLSDWQFYWGTDPERRYIEQSTAQMRVGSPTAFDYEKHDFVQAA